MVLLDALVLLDGAYGYSVHEGSNLTRAVFLITMKGLPIYKLYAMPTGWYPASSVVMWFGSR